MASPKKVAEPHKELRFTRAGQAQGIIIASAILFAFTLLITITWLMGHSSFHWWMPPIPLLMAAALLRLATRCTRHAYIILTPLGVEIFPLFKAEKNLNLIYWSELDDADFNEEDTLLKLHYNKEQTAGVVLSLRPILEKQRPLLKKAIQGRIDEKKKD